LAKRASAARARVKESLRVAKGKLDKLDAEVLERIGDAARPRTRTSTSTLGARSGSRRRRECSSASSSRGAEFPMSEPRESGRRPWFGGSLRRFGDSVLGLVETRLQILALEWAEERV
jgi:hypothetical protein